LVIRRFDNTSTLALNLNEIQVFVNNVNIIFPNPTGLTSYFADWSAKFTPIAPRTVNTGTEEVYNNIIEFSAEAESTGSTTALIINNIPLTFLNDIQAIVLYHRGGDGNIPRSVGLTIELYNSVDDSTLTQVLASTIPITDETKDYLHRYDFPSISTYTNGFFSTTYQSTTQIPDIGKGQQSTATINDIDTEVNLSGNTNVSNLVPEKINGLDAITTIAIAKVQGDGTNDKAVNCSVVRNSAGKYTATFSSARPDSNYVVNLSVIESGTDLDDIIITMNSNEAYGSGFTYSIHEGDNSVSAGTLQDRIHQFAVFDTF